MKYLQVYFLVYGSLFLSGQVHFDGFYLKDFSPLTPEFWVSYLDFPKITVEHMMYQDWSSLLWCMHGYLDVSEFLFTGFSFTLVLYPRYGHMLCTTTVFLKNTLIVVISQNCCKSINALRGSTAGITSQFLF